VQRMPMVPSKLGVGTSQGRVAVGFGLLDTVGRISRISNSFEVIQRAFEDERPGCTAREEL